MTSRLLLPLLCLQGAMPSCGAALVGVGFHRRGVGMPSRTAAAVATEASKSLATDGLSVPAKSGGEYDPLAAIEGESRADADKFFAAVDVNGDGEISSDELKAHLASVGYAESTVVNTFALLDVNKDGSISRDELRAAFVRYDDPALRLALGLGTSEADAIFDRIDTNGDGQLTKEELLAFMAEGGFPLNPSAADSIFATLDANDDGSISRNELREGYVRYSALRDALGMGSRRPATRASAKGPPKRWGRGNLKGLSLVEPPAGLPERLLTDSQRRRLGPVRDVERKRNTPRVR